MVIDDFYSVTIPNVAAIVTIDEDNNVILKKEFKYATSEELIEIPTGMFEPEESDCLEVAVRELLEETGYVFAEWTYFGDTVERLSMFSKRMYIYLAQNCKRVSDQKSDETEELKVLVVPMEEAIEMVMRNKIKCNSSAHEF